MTHQTVTLSQVAGVVTLTLNRPDMRNALSRAMRAEMSDALRAAHGSARCIVLTGSGRAFCSGQDLVDAQVHDPQDLGSVLRDEYEPLLDLIANSPVPTLAAVNGAAAGAGANLALACDVVIACESASFIQAFARIGLIPDAGGTYWLPRQVGLQRAMGAALFAEEIPARQAADWGMIWECVPDAEFADHVARRAAHLATGPGVAFKALKQAMRASFANDLPAQLALEARLQAECGRTEDMREGVAAFLEKRTALFQGR